MIKANIDGTLVSLEKLDEKLKMTVSYPEKLRKEFLQVAKELTSLERHDLLFVCNLNTPLRTESLKNSLEAKILLSGLMAWKIESFTYDVSGAFIELIGKTY